MKIFRSKLHLTKLNKLQLFVIKKITHHRVLLNVVKKREYIKNRINSSIDSIPRRCDILTPILFFLLLTLKSSNICIYIFFHIMTLFISIIFNHKNKTSKILTIFGTIKTLNINIS